MQINDKVCTRHGYYGTISKIYDDFSACAMSCRTMTGKEWLKEQIIPFTTNELKEMWAEIKCEPDGAVWSPLSLLTLL